MIKSISYLIFLFIFSLNLKAYEFSYKKNDISIDLSFKEKQIDEIKFKFNLNKSKNFGVIKYKKNEINIHLITDQITYDEFKKLFPKPQKNNSLNKKINFKWDISKMKISDKYILHSPRLEYVYDQGFESLTFYDSNKEFEFSILPKANSNKQIYLYSKNAGEFFKAQKITKNMIGGALFGKGEFIKFDNYNINIKVKDFSVNKDSDFYNLILSARVFDVFSILSNSQDEFNYLEVPLEKKGDKFNFDHALMLGGTVAFSFKGEANPREKTALVNGTYGPLYLFEKNFKDIPILKEFFGKNVEESLLAADFKIKKEDNKTSFSFNPLSILTPGKSRNFFDIWE